MYNANIAIRHGITLETILSKVAESEIYEAYLGKFKVGNVISCPWREDKHPSFCVYYSKITDKLLYKDFATGESGDIIAFVKRMAHLSNYDSVLNEIADKLGLTNKSKPSTQRVLETHALKQGKSVHQTEETRIGVVRQSYTKVDAEFWKRYEITSKTLKKFGVDSISYCLVNDRVRFKYYDAQPMYSYNVNGRFKIYRPYADKRAKWINNLTSDDIQGYAQLRKKWDVCIITKSMKDVMVLHEMTVDAVSVSSETSFLKDDLVAELKQRFKKLYILFDTDECGMANSLKFSKQYGIDRIILPEEFKSKDISDAVKVNSLDTVWKWLNSVLNQN
jgi:hypothetical protein